MKVVHVPAEPPFEAQGKPRASSSRAWETYRRFHSLAKAIESVEEATELNPKYKYQVIDTRD